MLIGLGIILATIAGVLLAYFGSRALLGSEPEDPTRDLAGSVLFRVSALHGLVLALVFASEVVEYQALHLETAHEVNAISDLYYDAARYGPEADRVQGLLIDYLAVIPDAEWRNLGRAGMLSGAAWAAWDEIYDILLDLTPETARQEVLRAKMLTALDVVADNRDLREHHAQTALNALFWSAALVGVVLISAGYFIYPPTRPNLILLGVFGSYTGLILFTIYAMSNPYSDPGALDPTLFRSLLQELRSASGAG